MKGVVDKINGVIMSSDFSQMALVNNLVQEKLSRFRQTKYDETTSLTHGKYKKILNFKVHIRTNLSQLLDLDS